MQNWALIWIVLGFCNIGWAASGSTLSSRPYVADGAYVLNCGRVHNRSKTLHTMQGKDLIDDWRRIVTPVVHDWAADDSGLLAWSRLYAKILTKVPGFRNPKKPIVKPNPCILVVKDQKTFLWEAGIPDAVAGLDGGVGRGGEPNRQDYLFTFFVDTPLQDSLAELGLRPEDIDQVAVSHLHYDHSGNLELFTNAKILLQIEEFYAGMDPSQHGKHHFVASTFDDIELSRVEVLDGEKDVFGDGQVVLHKMPGHTPGHQILSLQLESGYKLLSGDLYASRESYRKSLVPYFNADDPGTLESMAKFRQLVAELGARVWIQHDKDTYVETPEMVTEPEEQSVFETVYMGTQSFYRFPE